MKTSTDGELSIVVCVVEHILNARAFDVGVRVMFRI